jgi:hypothetical protein
VLPLRRAMIETSMRRTIGTSVPWGETNSNERRTWESEQCGENWVLCWYR